VAGISENEGETRVFILELLNQAFIIWDPSSAGRLNLFTTPCYLMTSTLIDFHYRPSIREVQKTKVNAELRTVDAPVKTLIVDAVYNFYRPCRLIHACTYLQWV
jgi:hypothetical protein